ncbi:MAG: flagellar biosynthesis protein [Burkholderiaceae bacterium]|nr:flagellar biosynthesis protein [Burkholderiaceae bacterium]
MPATPTRRAAAPRDQAHGLRQLFAGRPSCFVPLVHNPHVGDTGVVMERLCAAFATLGLRTLVVDAADTASPPHELAGVDLAACIEPLSPQVSYLAARGLAMNYLDGRATLTGFLEALRGAAPQADVVLLHAGALDLRRMFIGATPRPVLLAGAGADSLTHAYTSMKLLSQRLGALAYGLVVAGDVSARRARRMADRLDDCADHFLGAALRDLAVVDTLAPPHAPLGADLRRLAAGLVAPPGPAAAVNGLAELPAPRTPERRPPAAGRLN